MYKLIPGIEHFDEGINCFTDYRVNVISYSLAECFIQISKSNVQVMAMAMGRYKNKFKT